MDYFCGFSPLFIESIPNALVCTGQMIQPLQARLSYPRESRSGARSEPSSQCAVDRHHVLKRGQARGNEGSLCAVERTL